MLKIKNSAEIKKMRESGRRLAQVMTSVEDMVRPGIALAKIGELVIKEIKRLKSTPSFLNYRAGSSGAPFPSAICISVNSEVIHGLGNRQLVLENGDIVGFDMGLIYDGWHADMAKTVPVGVITATAQNLLTTTSDALNLGIKAIKPGQPLADIGRAIFDHVSNNNFGILTGFVGHGIGQELHEAPAVPNYPTPESEKIILTPGLVIAIEPMVTEKKPEIKIARDNWTVKTQDGGLGAHFEHTVAVTKDGAQVLTKI